MNAFLLTAACLASPGLSVDPASLVRLQDELPRVLFLTHSAGFQHGVVKRPSGGELAHAEKRLVAAARKRFEVVPTQDCATISAEGLEGFDAVLFYTTGELPIDAEHRLELMDWARAGGALAGVHSATDTWYEFAPYMELIGGAFDGHPWHQEVGVLVEDGDHPATRHLGSRFEIHDEIYQFRGDPFRSWGGAPLRVLLALDNDSVEIGRGKYERNPLAWWRDWGEGRAFYTALGHRPEVWEDERFLTHLVEGVAWAIDGPDLPAPRPAGAELILSGNRASGWKHKDGKPFGWERGRSGVRVLPGTGDLVSEREFGDFLLHVEFAVPEGGNSGVYLHGRYEVQVLDSHGRGPDQLRTGDCGGIYDVRAPSVQASRAPDRWQTLDIRFRAPRISDREGKTANARVSVWHNGILVQDDIELTGPTPGGLDQSEFQAGPILLQDHGNPVRYRNVWIVPEDQ